MSKKTANTEQQFTATNSPDVDDKSTNEQSEDIKGTKRKTASPQLDDRNKDTISRQTANTEQQYTPTVDDNSINGRTESLMNTANEGSIEGEQISRNSLNVPYEASGARNTVETTNTDFGDLEFESGDVGNLDTDRQTEYTETYDQNSTRQMNSPYYDSDGVCQYNPIPPTSTGIGSIQRMLKLCVETNQQNSTTPITPPSYFQLLLTEEQRNMNF